MRRKRIVIALAACVLVGIGLVAFWPGEREPEYQGKKLSEWLQVYQFGRPGARSFSESRAEAKAALEHIGAKALPWLMRWIQYERGDLPKWRVTLFVLACRLHVKGTLVGTTSSGQKVYSVGKSPVADLLRNFQKELANSAAAYGFKFLGAQTAAAIPDLIRLTQSSNSFVAARATYALSTIPNLVPQLVEMLTNETASVRCCAVRGLNSFDSLEHSFPGLDAAGLVPPLVQRLQDVDFSVRKEATNALLRIDPEALTNQVKAF